MSDLYARLDEPHFSYDMQRLGAWSFRGPLPDLDRPYFACVGGAQTMGRFTTDPYPRQLARALELPCLNLGLGGAGPRWALLPSVLPLLQRARLVVVQTFSARSASNARFDNRDQGRNYGIDRSTGARVSSETFFDDLLARGDDELTARTVAETRADYVHAMRTLGAALEAPTVLLWLSRRTPRYQSRPGTAFGWMREYPQFVDEAVLSECRTSFDGYAEVSEPIGLPQLLWQGEAVDGTRGDDDGRVWNDYYPSPQMHDLAAARLAPICRRLLAPPRSDAAASASRSG